MFQVKIEKRLAVTRSLALLIPVVAFALALITSCLLFLLVGVNPIHVYVEIAQSLTTFGGAMGVVALSIPLMLVALGLVIAFAMGFWNIGAEGQLYMGAFAATGVVLLFVDSPAWVLIPLMTISAFVIGGAWGLVPAILKAKLGVNEVLTTLMMNYIAMYWVDFLVYGPWRDPAGWGFPLTPAFPEAARLPRIAGTRVHIGLIYGIVVAALLYVLLTKTKLGFEIRVIGDNPMAAKYSGISYAKTVLLVMLISGGLAGLAGMSLVAGVTHRLRPRLSPGYGYTGIIGAWLANLNPWGTIPASLLLGALFISGDVLQGAMGLPFATALVFQSLIFIFLIGGEVLKRYKVTIWWKR
jgi:simple sugar transport system permease protein